MTRRSKPAVVRASSPYLVITLLLVTPAAAQPTPLPVVLPGGAGTTWRLANDGGTSNGLPAGGEFDGSPALAVTDAGFGNNRDAYDTGLMAFINHSVYAAPNSSLLRTDLPDGILLQAPAVDIGGLNVSMQYFIAGSPTLNRGIVRTYVELTNPSQSAPATARVDWTTNLGSDDLTTVIATSSGDTEFDPADSFIITDDTLAVGDPANTFILFRQGADAMPTAASMTVFFATGTEGILSTFELALLPGETRGLMFFNQISPNGEFALADLPLFTDYSALDAAGLLSGLSAMQLDAAANWVPAPASLVLLGLAATAPARRRRCR